MDIGSRVNERIALTKHQIVARANRFVVAHSDAYDRLAALTPIATNPGFPRYLFSTADREMSPRIYATGAYDPEELSWALDYLGQPQRDGLVVEVGANVGTTTVPLLTRYRAAAVEAFEPAPMNFKLLRCNLILNDVDQRAVLHQVAISDEDKDVRLELSAWNSGDNRVVAVDPSWEAMWESQRPTVKVEALRLDRALASAPADVSLVWVDVQGHEAQVLAGAEALLGHSDAPWVIEYYPYLLTRAGGLDRLHRLIAEHFSAAVEVRRSRGAGRAVILTPGEVAGLANRDPDWYTDLILLR